MRTIRFVQGSDLNVGPDDFAAQLTMPAVNNELQPLARMTCPAEWAQRNILDFPEHRLLFRSWILLFGLLPVDRHAIRFQAILPGRGFDENSWSIANRRWCHQRRISAREDGCRVEDIVEYESRLPLLGPLLKPAYQWVFRQRHRNLRSRYGGTPVADVGM